MQKIAIKNSTNFYARIAFERFCKEIGKNRLYKI
jgi:ribosomal protein L33